MMNEDLVILVIGDIEKNILDSAIKLFQSNNSIVYIEDLDIYVIRQRIICCNSINEENNIRKYFEDNKITSDHIITMNKFLYNIFIQTTFFKNIEAENLRNNYKPSILEYDFLFSKFILDGLYPYSMDYKPEIVIITKEKEQCEILSKKILNEYTKIKIIS